MHTKVPILLGGLSDLSPDTPENKTFVYMFPLTGQTAGPIGLKFFVDTQGWPGGDIG